MRTALPHTQYHMQTAGGSLMYDPGQPKLVLCENLEGWDGEEGGKVQDGEDKYILWLVHIDVRQKPC